MSKISTIFFTVRTIMLRFLPVVLFALALGWAATAVDKHNVKAAAGEEFVNYTSFTVQNAREGEDVYFSVCRDHKENYNFNGSLSVYVISIKDDKPVQVYATDIKGQITNECDNKVILAKDYRHTPNTYEMTFCVEFLVKYDIKKTVCKKSNRYRIYAQPTDLESRIRSLSSELEVLRAQRQDAVANNDTTRRSDLSTGQSSQPSGTTQPQTGTSTTPGGTGNAGTGTNPGNSGTTPPPAARPCTVTLLGLGLVCL